jgi:hypothetical protein
MRSDGSYSNEFEAAWDLSRRTIDRQPDADKIAALIGAGRCVVVVRYPMYCGFTDAYIGMGAAHCSDFIDRDNAEYAAGILRAGLDEGDDHSYEVLPKLAAAAPASRTCASCHKLLASAGEFCTACNDEVPF